MCKCASIIVFSVIQNMPNDWEPMDKGENVKLCDVVSGSEAYTHVTNMFKNTVNSHVKKASTSPI